MSFGSFNITPDESFYTNRLNGLNDTKQILEREIDNVKNMLLKVCRHKNVTEHQSGYGPDKREWEKCTTCGREKGKYIPW